MSPLLAIEGLAISSGPLPLVEDVSLDLAPGHLLGIVGESGSGKSLTVMSIPGLLPAGCRRVAGSITLDGINLSDLSEAALRRHRGSDIGVVFQDSSTSLNPVRRVGRLIEETLIRHSGIESHEARRKAIEALAKIGLPEPERKARAYPHELSGGQRQRVSIALAIANRPRLLIADEPTSALDATVQLEILDILSQAAREGAGGAIFVTHDLGAAAYLCDEIAVMYAGRIVEHGPSHEIVNDPVHPYTAALLACAPRIGAALVPAIPGSPPQPQERGCGCAFSPRCNRAGSECLVARPPLIPLGPSRRSACFRPLLSGTA